MRIPRTLSERIQLLRMKRDAMEQELCRAPTVEELAQELEISEDAVLETLEAEQGTFVSSWDANPVEKMQAEETDAEYALKDAIAQLDDGQKKLVMERFKNNRSQRETADILGVSQMSVSRMERKVLDKLRAILKKDESS